MSSHKALLLSILLTLSVGVDRSLADVVFLAHPSSSSVSSQYSGGFAGTFLHDGTTTVADVGTTNNQGGQWAGAGLGPHVMVYDMGSTVAFTGIFYAQRLGGNPATDKVTGIEFWVTNADPGAATTTLPILGTTVDHNLTVTNIANNNLTEYDFGTSLSGQYVVMRFTGNGGNPGGSELHLAQETAPADPDLFAVGSFDLGTVETNVPLLQGQFAVSNVGATQTLNISSVKITGADADRFVVSSFPATLAPAEAGEIVIDFSPLAEARTYNATMTITSDDTNVSMFVVALSATATTPLPAGLEFLPDPLSLTASTFFSGGFAPEFLYDATPTLDDIENPAFDALGQYAGAGAGPHVIVLDYGQSVTFDSFAYAQRLGGNPNTDKTPGLEFWVSDVDPGAAATNHPILSNSVDASVTNLVTTDNLLRYYSLGTTLSGRYVVVRFLQGAGNIGGSELALMSSGQQSSIPLTIIPAVSGYDLEWVSQAGMRYGLRSSEDLSGAISTWTLVEGDIPATPDTNTKNVTPSETTLFYAVEEYPAPAVTILFEDFDLDDGSFMSSDKSGGVGSIWEHGDPDSMSLGGNVLTGNGGTGNCWGTDISNTGFYLANTDVCLRSPVIDLTGVASATLSFAQAIDIEVGHTLVINIIDDINDDIISSAIHTSTPDLDTNKTTWTMIENIEIPRAALGQEVRIEWRFTTGSGSGDYIGAYIDDVLVTKPGS